ncbi:MAG: ABC transporter substrate-binding protein, partial [Actinobacteria bacterium]|nr:ABC transporter substrate-binding protein [Actinomycetota bacterium]
MLCGVVGLMGCGGGDENSGGTTNGGSSGVKEIKILVAAPLSGDYAETGKDMAQGAELAAAYINEQGGIKSGPNKGAKVVIERVDDEMSTSAATTIASRYLDDDSYYAFLGFI